ncbi:hypothetical protein RDV64_05630 [Acuticoccus sp. MNP-M23]|uniref:hypothetical protein n=1 Tax=Acuticoccus sp. MNP-M23 TaxID=3072793 RepID=UPI002816102C|nr:hypothetical protein [Acuticoccus sp. MNP-M23]WMS43874.1 hypothetical protein RDV64_05630 [Acuticoccus sp. MNP-M23]
MTIARLEAVPVALPRTVRRGRGNGNFAVNKRNKSAQNNLLILHYCKFPDFSRSLMP